MANETNYVPCRIKGNGTTLNFPFGWNFIEDTDVVVNVEDVTGKQTIQALGDNYTINIYENGGEVVFKTAPADSEYVIISRKTSNLQKTKYSTSTGFQGSDIEKSFDRFSCNLQEMDNNIENFKTTITNATDEKIEDFETEVNNKIEQVNDAVEKLDKLDSTLAQCETYSTNAINSANQSAANLAATEQLKNDVIELSTSTKSDITNLGASVQANIQTLGIFMENDRLFYIGSDGVKREFRNDFGGIAPMAIKHKNVKKVANGYELTWTDPNDSTYKENLYCKWDYTLIVAKEGSYPTSPFDGITVVKSTVRNAYQNNAFVYECDTTKDYYFRAFPCSINKVYSYDDKNKFGSWIYGYIECLTESNEEKRIQYIEDNEYFEPSYMDSTNDDFKENDWAGSPFYDWEYLRPVMLYNANAQDSEGNSLNGKVMEYLNPNDLTKTIDGQASHNADKTSNANAMMEKRGIFTYYKKEGNHEIIKFSNIKHSDEWECYETLKADGTYNEFYYTPIYECGLVNNILRSLSGLTPMNSQTGANEISFARANGAGWDTEVETDGLLERRIFKLLFKRLNSQLALGQGKSNGGNSAAALLNTGTMDKKGNNWGSSSTADGIKFRGRENFYGNRWDRYRGLVIKNGIPYVKRTKHTGDGSTVADYNLTGEGFIPLNDVPLCTGSSGGYGSGFTSTKHGMFATVVSGSATTGNCDGRWFSNTGDMYPSRGGSSIYGSLCGAFAFASGVAVSAAVWSIGAALSYKPS
jgi:hypothetical protein